MLVALFTDAAWTPLFLVASAVVVDLGAINSHAMVVARELGIPCVVSVQDAISRIPDRALVTVDGSAGTVTITAPSAGDTVAASLPPSGKTAAVRWRGGHTAAPWRDSR